MADYTLTLPTASTPKLKYRVVLDGAEFTFYFQYLTRGDSSWHLSIYDKQDTALLLNVKLVPWFDLMSALPKGKLPVGELGLVCLSQQKPFAPAITLENLSTDFSLVYYSVT